MNACIICQALIVIGENFIANRAEADHVCEFHRRFIKQLVDATEVSRKVREDLEASQPIDIGFSFRMDADGTEKVYRHGLTGIDPCTMEGKSDE